MQKSNRPSIPQLRSPSLPLPSPEWRSSRIRSTAFRNRFEPRRSVLRLPTRGRGTTQTRTQDNRCARFQISIGKACVVKETETGHLVCAATIPCCSRLVWLRRSDKKVEGRNCSYRLVVTWGQRSILHEGERASRSCGLCAGAVILRSSGVRVYSCYRSVRLQGK